MSMNLHRIYIQQVKKIITELVKIFENEEEEESKLPNKWYRYISHMIII